MKAGERNSVFAAAFCGMMLLLTLLTTIGAVGPENAAKPILVDAVAAESNLPFGLTTENADGAFAPLQVQSALEPRTPYFAVFRFPLGVAGRYTIWASVLGCDAEWVSEFTWGVDMGEMRRAVPLEGAGSGVPRWVKLGSAEYEAGEHALRFEVTKRRSHPDDAYVFGIWQVAVVPEESGFVPSQQGVELGYNPQINRGGSTRGGEEAASEKTMEVERITGEAAAPLFLQVLAEEKGARKVIPIWRDYAEGAVVSSEEFFVPWLVKPLRPRLIRKDHGLSRATGAPGEMDYADLVRLVRAVRMVGAAPVIGLDQLPSGCYPRNEAGEIKPRKEWLADPDFLKNWELTVRGALDALENAGLHETRFQCFNEPDFCGYAEYPELAVAIYDVAARVVKERLPEAEMFGIGCGDGEGPVWNAFLAYLEKHPDRADYFDFHIYQSTPERTAGRYRDLGAELSRRGLGHIRPAITEWGISSSGAWPLRADMTSAIYNAATLKALVDENVPVANLFCLRDFGDISGKFGLIGSDGALKPGYWAQWLWARLPDDGVQMKLTGTSGRTVDGIALRDTAGGKISLLIWYAGETAATPIRRVRIDVPELRSGNILERQFLLDGIHHIGFVPEGSEVALPAKERHIVLTEQGDGVSCEFQMTPNSMRLVEWTQVEGSPEIPDTLQNNQDRYGHMAM